MRLIRLTVLIICLGGLAKPCEAGRCGKSCLNGISAVFSSEFLDGALIKKLKLARLKKIKNEEDLTKNAITKVKRESKRQKGEIVGALDPKISSAKSLFCPGCKGAPWFATSSYKKKSNCSHTPDFNKKTRGRLQKLKRQRMARLNKLKKVTGVSLESLKRKSSGLQSRKNDLAREVTETISSWSYPYKLFKYLGY